MFHIFWRSFCIFIIYITVTQLEEKQFYNIEALLHPVSKQQRIFNKDTNSPSFAGIAIHHTNPYVPSVVPSFTYSLPAHTVPKHSTKKKGNLISFHFLPHDLKFLAKSASASKCLLWREKGASVHAQQQAHSALKAKAVPIVHEFPHSTPAKAHEYEDYPSLEGVDFIEILCSNALQSASFFQHVFGFQPLARCGLDTGNTEKTTYVLKQGNIHLLLTSAFDPNHPYSEHTKTHGDGVYAIGLTATDAEAAYHFAIKKGATSHIPPRMERDEEGGAMLSSISAYGDTKIVFVDRKKYRGAFLPGFHPWHTSVSIPSIGLKDIDHVVANVEKGKMKEWCTFFHEVLNFRDLMTFDDTDISTAYTALASTVVSNLKETIKFPINEPADGLKVSQIQEFLDFYKGPGCQHIALTTDDIVATVKDLRSRGCEFLSIPSEYYTMLPKRCGPIEESIEEMKAMNLLVDRDEFGYMIQTFTKPLSDRPTFFFEIIQRRGAKSFGKGNFKALFESVEAEQRKRGTLELY